MLGPLATYAEPHGYDLCQVHAARLTAPRGWQVIRLADNFDPPDPTPDDLEALADAVREAARPRPAPEGRSEGSGRRSADGAAPTGRDTADGTRAATRTSYLRPVPALPEG